MNYISFYDIYNIYIYYLIYIFNNLFEIRLIPKVIYGQQPAWPTIWVYF